MGLGTNAMVNENFKPNDRQEAILDVLKEGREEGKPWGYTNPQRLKENIDTRRQYINRDLRSLTDAGWVEKVNTGLYRFVEDPRDH